MEQLRTIALLVLSLAFVAGGLLIGAQGAGPERALGIACAAFFAACAIVFGVQLLPSEPPHPDAAGVTLIRPSRAQLLGFCAAGALMAAATPQIVRLAIGEGDVFATVTAILGVIVFGGASLLCLIRLVQPRALYRLDHVGIASLAAGQDWFVPWRAIRAIDAIGRAGQYFLTLDVDPAVPLPRGMVHGANRLAGFPPFTIGAQGSSVRFDQFAELVQRYWERGRLMQAHN
jgi:hypothetical protein